MINILLIVTFILFSFTDVKAEAVTFFEKGNTWDTAIPEGTPTATDSSSYIAGLIHSLNGGNWSVLGYATNPNNGVNTAIPIFYSPDEVMTTVIIDARDYVFLNTTDYRKEAQTVDAANYPSDMTTNNTFELMNDTNDYLYIGDVAAGVTNSVYFKLATLGSGYTLTVEYSKGSGTWGSVSGLSDGTTGFSADACDNAVDKLAAWTCKITFTLPGDWATDTVNGIGSRKWLRIKTTSTPTAATAYLVQFGDGDGEAALRGWNTMSIPSYAKGAGQDGATTSCGIYPNSSSWDGRMTIISFDGKWEYDFYQARKCPANKLPAQYQSDTEALAWHANTIRKRARTIAASDEELYVWEGDGIDAIDDLGGGVYSQYDGLGSANLCSASAHTHGIITRSQYNTGTINHALRLNYRGLSPTNNYGNYPCMHYQNGDVADSDFLPTTAKWMKDGMRVQLASSYNCNSNIPTSTTGYVMSRMMCEALKTYGAIFRDTSGSSAKTFSAESTYGRDAQSGDAAQSPWYGIPMPSPALPQGIWVAGNWRVVDPICNDGFGGAVCPNTMDESVLAPTSPSAADVTPDNGGVIRLNWTVSASAGVTEQRIYRGTATGVYSETPIQTIGNNTTATYDDAGLTNGTTYYYILRAYNGTHLSAYSTEVSATPSSQEAPVTPNSRDKVTRSKVTRSKVTRGIVTRP